MSDLRSRLLNEFQRDFPLSPTPFADLAGRLGVSEAEVLLALRELTDNGAISRVGPVFRPHAIGVSTLAAMAVPPARLDSVAAYVSSLDEVNHNYEREHTFNLWFVATARDDERLDSILSTIEAHTGLEVMSLPMLEDYHIDLGFTLSLNHL